MKRSVVVVLAASLVAFGGCRRTPKSVRVGFSPEVAHASLVVGMANRHFTRAGGVPVRASVYPAGPQVVEALLYQDVDIGFVDPVSAIAVNTRSKGRFVVVAGAAQGGVALVAARSYPATVPSDLRSARVATPHAGSAPDVSARSFFGEMGFTSYEHGGNFKIVPTVNTELLSRMSAGEIDAAWTTEPWVSQLVVQGEARVLIEESELWGVGRSTAAYPSAVVVIRKSLIKSHPDIVDDFLRIHVEETAWMTSNEARAIEIFGTEIARITRREFSPGVIARAWRSVRLDTEIPSKALQSYAGMAFRVGFLQEEAVDEAPLLVDPEPLDRVVSDSLPS